LVLKKESEITFDPSDFTSSKTSNNIQFVLFSISWISLNLNIPTTHEVILFETYSALDAGTFSSRASNSGSPICGSLVPSAKLNHVSWSSLLFYLSSK